VTDGSDLQDLQFIERGDPVGWNTPTEVLHSHIVITKQGAPDQARRPAQKGQPGGLPFDFHEASLQPDYCESTGKAISIDKLGRAAL
jgi:hypothetical protein